MADSIKVTLLDQDTLDPIEGATVAALTVSGDTSIDSDTTDASGEVTLTGFAYDTAYYITASATGYDPITKTGQYEGGAFAFQYDTSGEDLQVTLPLHVTRGRSAVLVMEGAGHTSGAPSVPVAGATVVVKRTDTTATVETLTTDASGVAVLSDSLYSSIGAIYATVSKTDYTTQTVYIGTSSPGDIIPVLLVAVPDITTHTLTVHLVDTAGAPRPSVSLSVQVVGVHSITDSGTEYYCPTGTVVSAITDASGVAVWTFAEGLLIKPVGWAGIFGVSDNYHIVMSEDIVLGDATIGRL